MKVLFNSSLPRSGSQVIQNVLNQNPCFYCTGTSGTPELLFGARKVFSTAHEFKLHNQEVMKRGFLGFSKGGLEGWYQAITEKPVVIDKSRAWQYWYSYLQSFYPNAKIICTVRDLRAVFSSMEKMYRRNGHLDDPNDNPATLNYTTIEKRVIYWSQNLPVGLALERLADNIAKGYANNFFFLVYEEFCKDPVSWMKKLYEYIEEPYFEHDFNNIEDVIQEDDVWHGKYGDHRTRIKLEPVKPDWNEILGKPLARAILQKNLWYYQRFYPHIVAEN